MAGFDTEVLVVGAGPVGLMLAAELRRRGISCLVVERLPEASVFCRALHVQSRTLEILEALGLAEAALRLGVRVRAENTWQDGNLLQRLALDWDPLPEIPYPMVLNLEQSLVEGLLAEHLASLGGSIGRQATVEHFAQDSEGVSATLRTGDGARSIRCRYLVGCDGAGSTVRKILEVPFEGEPYPDTFAMVDAEVEGWLAPEETHRFHRGTEVLVATPMRGAQRFRLSTRDLGPAHPSATEHGLLLGEGRRPTTEQLQAALDRIAGPGLHLARTRWCCCYRLSRRLAARFRVGRVFLVGDSAHLFPDLGGQGMNTGIQDAWNLAWKLALVLQGHCPSTLLDTYEAERRPVAAQVLERTDQAFRARTETPDWDEVLGPRQAMQRWAQLQTSYRGRPGFEQHGPGLTDLPVQAGDRAPDGRLALPGHGTRRVFDLLRSTEHQALFFFRRDQQAEALARVAARLQDRALVRCHYLAETGARVPPGLAPVHCDPGEAVATSYGVRESSVVLVRPDGYVGFRSDAEQAHLLLNWLDRLQGLQEG